MKKNKKLILKQKISMLLVPFSILSFVIAIFSIFIFWQFTINNKDVNNLKFKSEQLELDVKYENDRYYYNATVITPTPCYEVMTKVEILGSDEDKQEIIIDLIARPDNQEICVEVIDLKNLQGEIEATPNAKFVIKLNNQEKYTYQF
jgi:hypothetical protein